VSLTLLNSHINFTVTTDSHNYRYLSTVHQIPVHENWDRPASSS
jgi:hypothetical protein